MVRRSGLCHHRDLPDHRFADDGCRAARRTRRSRSNDLDPRRAPARWPGQDARERGHRNSRVENSHHRSALRPRDVRPRRRHAPPGDDRRARAPELVLRTGRPVRRSRRVAQFCGGRRARQRPRHVDGGLHHRAVRRLDWRQAPARGHRRRRRQRPAAPDIARPDSRAAAARPRSCGSGCDRPRRMGRI